MRLCRVSAVSRHKSGQEAEKDIFKRNAKTVGYQQCLCFQNIRRLPNLSVKNQRANFTNNRLITNVGRGVENLICVLFFQLNC